MNLFTLISALFVVVLVDAQFLIDKWLNPKLNDKVIMLTEEASQKCLSYLHASNMTELERCEFFKCFEERIPCGPEFWIQNWGYKYCVRYANPQFVAKFTPAGKGFLKHLNKCLPKALSKLYKTQLPQVSCKQLSRLAFEAQGKCYQSKRSQFCAAFSENNNLFIKVLDKNDFFNMDSIAMIKNSSAKCTPKLNLMSMLLRSG